MNKRQEAQLAMARTVRLQLSTAPEATHRIAGYAAAFRSLCTALDRIDQLALTQSAIIDGVVALRDQRAEAMTDAALALAAAVTAVIDPHRHGDLATRVRVRLGQFNRVGHLARVRAAQQVADVVREALPLVAADGITAELVGELQAKIDATDEALPLPRVHTVECKAATTQIAATLRRLDHILRAQLDPMLRLLRHTHPEFYCEYLGARMIVNPGRRRRPASSEETSVAPPPLPAAAATAIPRDDTTQPPAAPTATNEGANTSNPESGASPQAGAPAVATPQTPRDAHRRRIELVPGPQQSRGIGDSDALPRVCPSWIRVHLPAAG